MIFIFFLVLEAHVELLVRAHDCFTLACNMEGISEVLRIARLCILQLMNAKAYSLMVILFYFLRIMYYLHSGLLEILHVRSIEMLTLYFVKAVFGL